jgi:hypothetical protein
MFFVGVERIALVINVDSPPILRVAPFCPESLKIMVIRIILLVPSEYVKVIFNF